MASTFDSPVLVHEIGEGRYRLYRGQTSPDGGFTKPSDLPHFYRITGPFDIYFQFTFPTAEMSRAEVLAWLGRVIEMGCKVRVVDVPIK